MLSSPKVLDFGIPINKNNIQKPIGWVWIFKDFGPSLTKSL